MKILFLVLMLVFEANPSLASECWARRSVSEELKKSTVVFSGTAVAEEYRTMATPQRGRPDGGEILVIKFSVERWWKGSGEEEVLLYTGVSRWPGGYTRSFAEGFDFIVGEKYLVYGSGAVDNLTTSACERTTKLEKAGDDLKALGEGRLPEFTEAFRSGRTSGKQSSQQETLVFPGLLKKEALEAGNPLATYAAMIDLAQKYQQSKIFAGVYPEIRFNFEEFLGLPLAGVQAMSLPVYHRKTPSVETPIPVSYEPQSALKVIEREARKTRLVIFGEEHHLPQTRSLYESLLRVLWRQGYRYLAAETFTDEVMRPDFKYPDYQSGYYSLDPVFASAFRVAKEMGYKLIAYDTKERGPSGDASFRDRTQAENIKVRTFDLDPQAKVFIIAGRGHASEETAQDGWTPMASVLKRLTGIDPLTVYAPSMSQRVTAGEEDPLYRSATSRGLVKQPTIFVSRHEGRLLGSGSFDAYIFWPRIKIEDGRPDWMRQALGRKRARIPPQLWSGRGMRLVQAFREGDRASAIPVDQVIINEPYDRKVLMLPAGRYWVRTIDRDSIVIAEAHLSVP